jgi:hypothetical protein
MERFIHDHNLALFLRRLLAEQDDMNEERRQLILKLLAEEAEEGIDRRRQGASVGKLPHAP